MTTAPQTENFLRYADIGSTPARRLAASRRKRATLLALWLMALAVASEGCTLDVGATQSTDRAASEIESPLPAPGAPRGGIVRAPPHYCSEQQYLSELMVCTLEQQRANVLCLSTNIEYSTCVATSGGACNQRDQAACVASYCGPPFDLNACEAAAASQAGTCPPSCIVL